MKRYFNTISTHSTSTPELTSSPNRNEKSAKQCCNEVNLANLPTDPGERPRISDYPPNIQDEVRRAYLQKGPCQPSGHDFPYSMCGDKSRRFNSSWFEDGRTWLEYSKTKDALFCLYCYLFKPQQGERGGGDSFVVKGFRNWKKKDKLQKHVGDSISVHNQAFRSCEALMNRKQHIETLFTKHTDQENIKDHTRLVASVDCVRFLLRQGLPFRGHDESENSSNRGNFLELLQWLGDHNEDIKAVTLKNAPGRCQMVSPSIQKDIVRSISTEIVNSIFKDMCGDYFTILIDESRDSSSKEQMAIVIRYINEKGFIIERFVGIEHVVDTTALSLKASIDSFFSRHSLSISQLRGQGYDGASNMQGEFNGLKTPILKENECAFYIHCFAHQLQLALVAVAKKHVEVTDLFTVVANVVNIVGSSSKRRDILRELHANVVIEAYNNGEISSGKGLNQEIILKRPGDTRWSSHHITLIRLIGMFSSVLELLEIVMDNVKLSSDQRNEAKQALVSIRSFNFIFCLHLIKTVLGISSDLSQALQKKDQNIVNAMTLVRICKERLQIMRDSGWNLLLDEVSSFCEKHDIDVCNMNDVFCPPGRSRRRVHETTNMHHYQIEIFYTVIDLQLQELNSRFSETSTELLICLACLDPTDSFSAFDKSKLVQLAKFYPKDFSTLQLVLLGDQLDNYIMDLRSNIEFSSLKGISGLAQKLVETKKDKIYPLVYLLIKLVLLLPVATASVERVFSAMNIIKDQLRNRIGDEWMNDCMIAYIEKDVFDNICNSDIVKRFKNMKTRRGQF